MTRCQICWHAIIIIGGEPGHSAGLFTGAELHASDGHKKAQVKIQSHIRRMYWSCRRRHPNLAQRTRTIRMRATTS
jgi:hypothetical protein